MARLSIYRCSLHNVYAVALDGTRLTPSKCCGSWDHEVKFWRINQDDLARMRDDTPIPDPAPSRAELAAALRSAVGRCEAIRPARQLCSNVEAEYKCDPCRAALALAEAVEKGGGRE